MTQHLSLKDEDLVATTIHHTKAKEEMMHRKRETKKTRQDKPHESMDKTTQPITLPGGVRLRTERHDFLKREVIQNVQRDGLHVVGVYGERFCPPFAYSVGLYQTFGQPEIFIIGLSDVNLGPAVIKDIGRLIRKGVKFADGTESDQIIKRHPCAFREVLKEFYPLYFGFANWYYRGWNYPVLQCVYPDHEGRFPWQPGASPELRAQQPVLSSLSAMTHKTVLSSLIEAMQMSLTSNEEAQ